MSVVPEPQYLLNDPGSIRGRELLTEFALEPTRIAFKLAQEESYTARLEKAVRTLLSAGYREGDMFITWGSDAEQLRAVLREEN